MHSIARSIFFFVVSRCSHALPRRWLVAAKLLPKSLFGPVSTFKTTTGYFKPRLDRTICTYLLYCAARQLPPRNQGFAARQRVRTPKLNLQSHHFVIENPNFTWEQYVNLVSQNRISCLIYSTSTKYTYRARNRQQEGFYTVECT